MKPVIGVMPLWDDKKDSIWMLPGYMEGIREAGGLPIILDFMEDTSDIRQVVEMCNGFLLQEDTMCLLRCMEKTLWKD